MFESTQATSLPPAELHIPSRRNSAGDYAAPSGTTLPVAVATNGFVHGPTKHVDITGPTTQLEPPQYHRTTRGLAVPQKGGGRQLLSWRRRRRSPPPPPVFCLGNGCNGHPYQNMTKVCNDPIGCMHLSAMNYGIQSKASSYGPATMIQLTAVNTPTIAPTKSPTNPPSLPFCSLDALEGLTVSSGLDHDTTVHIGSRVVQASSGDNCGNYHSTDLTSYPVTQLYTNGDRRARRGCQTPDGYRQSTVTFLCGTTNRITKVTESPKCNYQISLESPQACCTPDSTGTYNTAEVIYMLPPLCEIYVCGACACML